MQHCIKIQRSAIRETASKIIKENNLNKKHLYHFLDVLTILTSIITIMGRDQAPIWYVMVPADAGFH